MRNKPRVFLSHSKKDEDFILRIRDDFLRCQIDSWVDTFEIRHGKPWMDQIFENGIPTCDSILVYVTEDSLKSPVVKKEIDASLIQQLGDDKIAFLPYVSEEKYRDGLRVDIRALQVPVWNNKNYHEILAVAVSEIWRSYLERTVVRATNSEKVKRLEMELKVAQNKDAGIFTESEDKDFAFIKKSLDIYKSIGLELNTKNPDNTKQVIVEVNLLSLIPFITGKGNESYYDRLISDELLKHLRFDGIVENTGPIEVRTSAPIEISHELLMFGLIERVAIQESESDAKRRRMFHLSQYKYLYSQKMERFKYWLAYHDSFPPEIKWKMQQEN